MKTFDVHIEIRGEVPKGGYRLKVSVLDLGMYIDGFRAYPSKQVEGTWAIYAPSTAIGGNRYKDVIEFAKTKQLWAEIAAACEEAIEIHTSAELRETIRNSDIPF
jgi:hypothetical protein